jgi:hypothetical protein
MLDVTDAPLLRELDRRAGNAKRARYIVGAAERSRWHAVD